MLYHGEDLYAPNVNAVEVRKRIGMVFQKPNPFPKSIYDNVAYGPRVHGVTGRSTLDAIVEKSLRGAALWDEVKDRLHTSGLGLSGGQQQRLCIARAIALARSRSFTSSHSAAWRSERSTTASISAFGSGRWTRSPAATLS